MYLHSKLYELDLSDSHLSEDEIAELMERCQREAKQEEAEARARAAKRNSFRFKGGML